MEDKNSALLPYILYVLSRKPFMCDTIENVCKEVREELVKEKRQTEYNDLPNSVKEAVEVGQDLGILYQTKESLRLPFQFHGKRKKPAPAVDVSDGEDLNSKESYCSECGCCKEISPPKKKVRSRRRASGLHDRVKKRRGSKSKRSRSRKNRRHSRKRR